GKARRKNGVERPALFKYRRRLYSLKVVLQEIHAGPRRNEDISGQPEVTLREKQTEVGENLIPHLYRPGVAGAVIVEHRYWRFEILEFTAERELVRPSSARESVLRRRSNAEVCLIAALIVPRRGIFKL